MRRRRATSGLCCATVVILSLSGCGWVGDMHTGDSFDDRVEALDAVYEQGKSARKSMEKRGLIVDETSCGSSWVTTGAQDAENDMARGGSAGKPDVAFQELRRLSFINGCMDRPNNLPAINAPTLPDSTPATTSPAPSVTPS